jgi:hypothetical protein
MCENGKPCEDNCGVGVHNIDFCNEVTENGLQTLARVKAGLLKTHFVCCIILPKVTFLFLGTRNIIVDAEKYLHIRDFSFPMRTPRHQQYEAM